MTALKPQNIDIHLQAGDIFFGKAPTKIKTLLGSCVALTVWHEQLQLGGICHYLIVHTEHSISDADIEMHSYRYASPALEYLYKKMMKYAPVNEYEICIFGGSNMYSSATSPSIGENNVAFAQNWLTRHKLTCKKSDVLGNICRTISFDLSNGKIFLQRYRHEA